MTAAALWGLTRRRAIRHPALPVSELRPSSRHGSTTSGTAASASRRPTLIERGLNGGLPVYVHGGDCDVKGKRSRSVSEDQARCALAEEVAACNHCRPDTDLGESTDSPTLRLSKPRGGT
ncbi:DUF6233 domain-containing protein [Streptomyces sp. NPDC059759]|uniref:DUF6233 domain-containing protein n=1 Tax=Streptomyces sp. NPDC059759 TaxID=3346936 RepID=UPI00364FA97F